MNHNGKTLSIESGVGLGLTAASDKLTFKLMVSRDLNFQSRHWTARRLLGDRGGHWLGRHE